MLLAPQLSDIDIIVGGACLLACFCVILLWRQRHHRTALDRLHARLQRERAGREQAEQALADTRRQVCHLSASQQSLRDAERRRIARDLHDDLGQRLLTVQLELRALGVAAPENAAALATLDAQLQAAVRALRTVVRDLLPEALENGLQQAVAQQLAQFSRVSGIACQLDARPDAFEARDAQIDKTIYRVLQESLSNIARHAQASQISVAIARAADRLNLTVRDNGIGLPAALAQPPGSARSKAEAGSASASHGAMPRLPGAGLRGIAERVSEAGGRLDVASTPGAGTELSMSFPLHVPHAAAPH